MEAKLPKAKIKQIIDNPEQFALEFGELIFVKNLPKYLKAYNHGQEFAKENLKNKRILNNGEETKNQN